jgi:Ion channel
MTTVATVGYGDVFAVNTFEYVFAIILMIIGVSAFTFVSGALSSILSSYD